MPKILFVDDDPHVLQSISGELYEVQDRWQLFFAASGEEALALLARETVDVVVADFWMPTMTGLELLSRVEYIAPSAIRVMLTAKPDKIKYTQTVNICHYVFWKPLHHLGLKRFLQRMEWLFQMLPDPKLQKKLNGVTSLPMNLQTPDKLNLCLEDMQSEPCQLAHVAGKDMALAMQLFKLASSAQFACQEGLPHLEAAIAFLDMEVIRSLVATQHTLFAADWNVCPEFKLDLLQDHSLAVVRLAGALVERLDLRVSKRQVALGSLLHDVGRLVIAHCLPAQCRQVAALAQEQGLAFAQAEQHVIGVDHAQIGAYLAILWGLPDAVVDAVSYHCQPQPPDSQQHPEAFLVWHANRLAQGRVECSQHSFALLCQEPQWAAFLQRRVHAASHNA